MRRIHKSREFGDNTHSGKFFAFKRRLRISTPLYFPGGLDKLNTDQATDGRMEVIYALRKLNHHEYLAACCTSQGYNGGMIVDVKSMRTVRPVVAVHNPIYNLDVYKNIVIYSDSSHSIFVTGLATPESDRAMLSGLRLSSSSLGSSLNCGGHIIIDGHMAYLFCS